MNHVSKLKPNFQNTSYKKTELERYTNNTKNKKYHEQRIIYCYMVSNVALKCCDVTIGGAMWRTRTQSTYDMKIKTSFQTTSYQVLINLVLLRSPGRRCHPCSIIKGNVNRFHYYRD